MTPMALSETLGLFLDYTKLLYDFAFQVDPRVASSVAQLFTFHRTSGDEFFLPTGTFLHDFAERLRQSKQSTDLGKPVTGTELQQTFRAALCDHLRQTHMPGAAMTIEWYNARVRIRIQQVLVLQTRCFVGAILGSELDKQKRLLIGLLYEAINPAFYYLGNPSLLDADLIPEFQKGIHVIRDWLRRLRRLDGSFHGLTLPRSWLIRHVKDPERAKKKDTQLQIFMINQMPDLLETIYSGVGAGFLLFDTSDISNIPRLRPIFIARICRALCLLGYNFNNVPLRAMILRSIVSLRRADRKSFPALYRRFVSAQRWENLVRALRDDRDVLRGSLTDELVQFHNLERGPLPSNPVTGVRLVAYAAHDDLSSLLGNASLSNLSLEEDQQQHKELESSMVESESKGTLDVEGEAAGADEIDEIDAVNDLGNMDDLGEELPNEFPSVPTITPSDLPQAQAPTDEEQRAAPIIQAAYKRALLRRMKQAARTGLAASRTRKFALCLESAMQSPVQWGAEHFRYRVLLLGPLPHVLLCLDIAQAAALAHKKTAKKHLRSASHEKLENLQKRLTELSKIYKALSNVQKTLEPSSDLHKSRDIAALRRSVEGAVKLLEDLPFTTPEDLQFDLGLGYKGIVAVKKPPKAPEKPSLVCEDDL
ncbi:hypothetical protein DXG03_002002 [Asterophora parasitica]|uniref:Uncharacterized protein n=1 Tax=Asterophora parasitica TaxID=117018 RepID=A0A9P7GBQ2_9AGAR|nr:hypothetical protein DXG03_002002 [Asterophora parasitica]